MDQSSFGLQASENVKSTLNSTSELNLPNSTIEPLNSNFNFRELLLLRKPELQWPAVLSVAKLWPVCEPRALSQHCLVDSVHADQGNFHF